MIGAFNADDRVVAAKQVEPRLGKEVQAVVLNVKSLYWRMSVAGAGASMTPMELHEAPKDTNRHFLRWPSDTLEDEMLALMSKADRVLGPHLKS